MTPTLSAESTAVKCGVEDDEQSLENANNNIATKGKINRRATPRYHNMHDRREDEADVQEAAGDGMGRVAAPEDEMGFEVEMSLKGSGSVTEDNKSKLPDNSDKTNLDFPLEELSASSSNSSDDKIATTDDKFRSQSMPMAQSKKHTRNDQGKLDGDYAIAAAAAAAAHSAIEESLATVQLAKNRKKLFVDVNAEPVPRRRPTSDLRDETPRTNNRSESNKASNFALSPAYQLSTKNRKKEVVAQTLATVVQEVDSPMKQANAGMQTDSVGESETDDDSSAMVDERWNTLWAKYAQSKEHHASSTSEDLNEEEWRDNLLDVNSGISPRSHVSGDSVKFEEELIQDCIDTGLPSPEKVQAKHVDNNLDFSQSERSSPKTPIHEIRAPKGLTSPAMNMPFSQQSQKKTMFPRNQFRTGKEAAQFDALARAKVETVSSTLTGDEEFRDSSNLCPTLSSNSNIDLGECGKIGSALSEKSQPENYHQIVRGQSSPTNSMVHNTAKNNKTNQETNVSQSTRVLQLPKKSLVGYLDEHIFMPKIEISLAPTASSSEQSISEVSESSCADAVDDNAEALQAHQGSQQENNVDATTPKCDLYWWRKNGKTLVEEKLLLASTANAPLNPLTNNVHTVKERSGETSNAKTSHSNNDMVDEQEVFRDESLLKESSPRSYEESQANGGKFESAFKRGLSMFEKRTKKVKRPVSPAKKKWQTPVAKSSKESVDEKPRRITSVHAPQPNPDADSSNSVSRGRQLNPTLDHTATVSRKRSPSPTLITQNRRLIRPVHEEGTADDALELVRSPRVLTDSAPRSSTKKDSSNQSKAKEAPAPAQQATTSETEFAIVKLLKHSAQEASPRNDLPTLLSPQETPTSAMQDIPQPKTVFIKQKDVWENSPNKPSAQRWLGECGHDEDILDVTSTLTGETSINHQSDKNLRELSPTLFANKAEEFEARSPKSKVTPSRVGHKPAHTFDAKGASGEGPSWRLKPAESLSDFSVQIYCKKSSTIELYNVHQHVLGVGPRRSLYLEKIFRSTSTASTKIELVDEASAFVPHLLDFVYCHDFQLGLTTENAMTFRYLAAIFKVSPILKQTAEFILNDMKIENMSRYISESAQFHDDVVTKMIAAKCGEAIDSIGISDELWIVMEPILFLRVLSCPRINRKKISRHLSLLLVEYHDLHKHEVNTKMFQDLSSISILPLIHRNAAIPLLEICDEYGAPLSLQPLQKRCAQVMAVHWKTTSEPDRRRLFSLLRSLPSNFTVDFLETVETGRATTLIDSTISKVLRESNYPDDDYEHAESFNLEKLLSETGTHQREQYCQGNTDMPLSWRMDPDESFSDWRMKVKHRHDGKIDTYHIHKHILAVGQYKCTFFAEIFLSHEHTNASKGSTLIELAEGPANLVPIVLDFIYSPEHDLLITTRTASTLRFLSRVFGVWVLNKKVVEYVRKDMDLTNMLLYLEHAELYDDERITSIAIRKCATNIKEIDPESDLLRGIKPDFFGRVVASTEIDTSASCHINILIAKYFTLHELDESLLGQLLKHVPMKEIDQYSALQLLRVMSSVKSKGVAIFSDIRKRCSDILIENWKEIREDNRQETFKILRMLDPELVADIFDAVERQYNDEHYETMSIQSKLVKRYRAQLAEAKAERDNDIAKLREESEVLLSELLQKQQIMETQIAEYQDATSRRALRSSGGFSNARTPSPRPSSYDSSRQSFIPRLHSQSTRVSSSPSTVHTNRIPTETPTSQDRYTPTPRGKRQTTSASCQPQTSLFGRVFTCTPSTVPTEQRAQTVTMPHQLMSPRHMQHRFLRSFEGEVVGLESKCL